MVPGEKKKASIASEPWRLEQIQHDGPDMCGFGLYYSVVVAMACRHTSMQP